MYVTSYGKNEKMSVSINSIGKNEAWILLSVLSEARDRLKEEIMDDVIDGDKIRDYLDIIEGCVKCLKDMGEVEEVEPETEETEDFDL